MTRFHSCCLRFSKRGQNMLKLSTHWDAVRWKIPDCFRSLLAGGKVAHFENGLRKIALESKRLIHDTWWTWCQITWKRIFGSNTVKTQGHSIKNVVEITDQSRCILFGQPCSNDGAPSGPNKSPFELNDVHFLCRRRRPPPSPKNNNNNNNHTATQLHGW